MSNKSVLFLKPGDKVNIHGSVWLEIQEVKDHYQDTKNSIVTFTNGFEAIYCKKNSLNVISKEEE